MGFWCPTHGARWRTDRRTRPLNLYCGDRQTTQVSFGVQVRQFAIFKGQADKGLMSRSRCDVRDRQVIWIDRLLSLHFPLTYMSAPGKREYSSPKLLAHPQVMTPFILVLKFVSSAHTSSGPEYTATRPLLPLAPRLYWNDHNVIMDQLRQGPLYSTASSNRSLPSIAARDHDRDLKSTFLPPPDDMNLSPYRVRCCTRFYIRLHNGRPHVKSIICEYDMMSQTGHRGPSRIIAEPPASILW